MRARLANTACAGMAALSMAACASVKVSVPGFAEAPPPAPLAEHTELRRAADTLARTVPEAAARADKAGLHTVVWGGRDDAERAAARAYLAGLGAGAGVARIHSDAEAVLAAGRDLAVTGLLEPGDHAAPGDVDLLEGAITQVQRSRRLMTTALKILREEGAPLTKAEIRELGDAFVQTARDIGAAADMAAAREDGAAPRYADRPGAGAQGY